MLITIKILLTILLIFTTIWAYGIYKVRKDEKDYEVTIPLWINFGLFFQFIHHPNQNIVSIMFGFYKG